MKAVISFGWGKTKYMYMVSFFDGSKIMSVISFGWGKTDYEWFCPILNIIRLSLIIIHNYKF